MTTDTERGRDYARAYDLGRQARNAGRPERMNPFMGHTPTVRDLHAEWQRGWNDRARELARRSDG